MSTAKSKIPLEDDQKFALMKFRHNVKDLIKPKHNDAFLLRWLRARSWNVEAAEKMFRESMNWRQQWEVDDGLKTWVPPEVITKYVASGICGFDKDDFPIYIVPIQGVDIVGLLHSVSRQDLIRYTIQLLEKLLDLAAEKNGTECVLIFDLENFNLRPYTWRPATEVVISLLQMYAANYPEILRVCYIINAPRVFSIAYSVIKRFIDEYTISKINIFKNDPKKWQKVILQNIDPEQLPQHWGGSMVDPDGNPKCPSKVKLGGKVPESYYKKNLEKLPDDKDFVQETIKKGAKISLDFIVADEGCFLKWEFRTDGHDIRFGVSCRDEEGVVHEAVQLRRVASHQMDVAGVLSCKSPATYTVTFDNSYSLFKSKKIHYSVQVTPPLDTLDLSSLPVKENDSSS
ncbi:PREDICTED: SEC14-like protein 2 [Nicrophorus vespilloides]|uniref:SEC14-like protein 2 n=1 Tax=Nicrophorus vespilloides TaxID=110193 RepID=A0ABM1N525_NICVS|nr:PREDICTED: SEC14-like protein 2 [Nicrophorus vespilloides]